MDEPEDVKSIVEAMAIWRCPFGGIGAYRANGELCTLVCAVRNDCKEAKEGLRRELDLLRQKLEEGSEIVREVDACEGCAEKK